MRFNRRVRSSSFFKDFAATMRANAGPMSLSTLAIAFSKASGLCPSRSIVLKSVCRATLSGAGRKTFQTAAVIAIEDLVAGLPRDAEPKAKNRHLLSVQQPGNELQPFIHEITLLPGHFALLAKGPIV